MSDSDERERIREQKRKELIEEHSDGNGDDRSAEAGGETPSEPIEIESQEHFEEVTSQYDLVLVDCYADWCGPCQVTSTAP